MNSRILKAVTVLAWTALAGSAPALAAANRIEKIQITEALSGESAQILIESSDPLRYKTRVFSDPPRAVLEFKGNVTFSKKPLQQIEKKLIQKIEYAFEQTSKKKRRLQGMTLFLARPCKISAIQKEWVLTVTLKQTAPVAEPLRAEVETEPASAAPLLVEVPQTKPEVQPALLAASTASLSELVRMGLSRHKPLEIARKDLKLAEKKLFEARRNFFPVLTGKGSQTKGTTQSDPNDPTTRADFTRREYGVEVGQPLFQSGKIYYSAKQARAQRDVSELQLTKIIQDVTFDVIRAAYAFVVARDALTQRRAFKNRADRTLELTRYKRDTGLASESEYLGVLSGANQASYRTLSQEKDLEIARVRLMNILNTEELPDIHVDLSEKVLRYPKTDWKLDSLVNLALAGRADIKIAEYTSKAKEFGRKIARADYLFKVDASGFMGQSGAAFRSENIAMKDSYNFGIKGSLYFGGSSINPVASKEKTAPDLGSTSRTETEAQSVNVGILDSLGASSNLLSATIEQERAVEDLRKTRKDITLEVKEAFFNYQKAKVQIESARSELDYRRKEAAISEAKDRLHQIEAPQVLQAQGSLAEAEIGLKEAVSFYFTSLAGLEKAVGAKLAD